MCSPAEFQQRCVESGVNVFTCRASCDVSTFFFLVPILTVIVSYLAKKIFFESKRIALLICRIVLKAYTLSQQVMCSGCYTKFIRSITFKFAAVFSKYTVERLLLFQFTNIIPFRTFMFSVKSVF